MATTAHDPFKGQRKQWGKLISVHYLDLPTPQEKKQNSLRKQHRLKQSVVRTGAALMREGGERKEVGRVLQKGFLGEDKCRSPKGKQKEEKGKGKQSAVRVRKEGEKSRRDDAPQCHSKNCCFPVHDTCN